MAEDSASQRAIVAGLLREEGLEVHEAEDGRVALDLCRIIHPDLLVLDLGLPRLDGAEVLTRLRKDRKIGTTPVLVLTADGNESTVAGVLDAGATDFVTKGAPPAELLARIRRALRDKGARDELVERNRTLAEAAQIDALTGLPNRRACAEALSEAAARAREARRPLAVAIVDIDHFKAINDTHGHGVGDQALTAIAGRLRDSARTTDVVGRWGGEEFLVVLPNTGPDEAAATAEALRDASGTRSLLLGDMPLTVTVSVGWACSEEAAPKQLVELADAALYAAKADGRNCVRAAG